MNMLNDQATAALNNLDSADAAYCQKLAQHLAAMGLSGSTISSAVKHLADTDAVPSFVPAVATPSMFGSKKAAAVQATAMEEGLALA